MSIQNETRNCLQQALANPAAAREVRNILELLEGGVGGASFTIGTESGGNAIVVSIQLTDDQGNNIAQRIAVPVLLLADANGDAFNTNNYTIAGGTDGALAEILADKVLLCISEADGDIDVSLTISGAATCYLAVVLPGGKLAISGAITHAA